MLVPDPPPLPLSEISRDVSVEEDSFRADSFRIKFPSHLPCGATVCIYPITEIYQDPIHLGKQLENM